MADLYSGGGGVVIDAIYLVINEGKKDEYLFDLIDIFGDCSLYESVEDVAMSASVTMIDGYNIKDNLNLYGGERLVLDFHTAGAESNLVHYTGRLYKVGHDKRVSEHINGYVLYFVSDICYESNRKYLNSHYEGTVSDIITKMVPKDYLAGKSFNITPTVGIKSYTFGKERLLDALSYCTRGAISASTDTGYMFYENSKAFVFTPISMLYKSNPVVQYSYNPSGFFEDVKQRNVERFNSVQNVEVLEDGDAIMRMFDGQHGSTWEYFDIMHKKLYTYRYDKTEQWKKDHSLGERAVKNDISNKAYTDNTFFIVIDDPARIPIDKYHIGQMKKLETQTIRLRLMTYGDSGIKAGDTCLFELPDTQITQGDDNRAIGGKFLIYSIKHVLNKYEYKQTIEICKDSYEVH